MLEIPFFPAEALYTLLWLAMRILIWRRQKRIDRRREAVLLLMYFNLAVILRFTFFPMAPVNGQIQPLVFDAARVFPLRVNLIPFVKLRVYAERRDLLVNVLGNVALFLPGGIVYPIVYKRLDSFRKVLSAGAGLSLFVEILQLPFHVRATDVDDLIQNTVGIVIGYGIYTLARRRKAKKP